MLVSLATFALFIVPTLAGCIVQYFKMSKRRFRSIIFDGLLVSAVGVLAPTALGVGLGVKLADLILAAVSLGTMWPLFFFLGFRLAEPFLQFWEEKHGPLNPGTSIRDEF